MLARSLSAALAVCALAPATAAAATHTVAPGETLWGIAMANNLPTSAEATAKCLWPESRVVCLLYKSPIPRDLSTSRMQ
jgi:hypothetical protein